MKRSITLLSFVLMQVCLYSQNNTPRALILTPNYVNLARNQTPIRDQGARNTCITFAAIGGLEAAYKRSGYGDLNLSEQFLNYMGKTFWLDFSWSDIVARGNDGKEAQVGAFGGGQGYSYIKQLGNGLKVPDERLMPYKSRDYDSTDFRPLRFPWDNSYWLKQKRMSDFNMDTVFLPPAALVADKYYSIASYGLVSGNDVNAIEQILRSGKEVVWDMTGYFPSTPIWDTASQYTCSNCGYGSHAMLIIGYDRRDRDPKKHCFIIKNSWGPVPASLGHNDGFTRVTYDYVKAYGNQGSYINSVNPPARWTPLGFVGRWDINLDGVPGILDIYHVQHVMEVLWKEQGVNNADNRLGTFYDRSGKAYKVNGYSDGMNLHFFINLEKPNVIWDDMSGRQFNFTLLEDKGRIMAGSYTGLDGKIYGGYAKKKSVILPPGKPYQGTLTTSSYMGDWKFMYNNTMGMLSVGQRDQLLSGNFRNGTYDAYSASFYVPGGQSGGYAGTMFVEKANPMHVIIQSMTMLGLYGRNKGYAETYLLNTTKGALSGQVFDNSGKEYGIILFRQ